MNQLAASPSVTASDRAYLLIWNAIASGEYKAGDSLREEELAVTAGVSRTPVREALRRLDAEGLVELLPNRGAKVAGWSPQDLDEIFDLRVLLESYGARIAAHTIADGELAELRDLCEAMEVEVNRSQRVRYEVITDLNNSFHRAILKATGNRRLVAVSAAVVQRALVARTFHLYSPDELRRSCAGHRELVAALACHDGDWAESTMRAHLFAGRQAASGG